ncbi:MAG: hypothetical protein ACYS0G_07175 [Planctomycetota bacterium]|jgi:c-di-GMP-binding flagellar brake protein YcgR
MPSKSGLRVRQHQRQEIELPVEFVVCEEHRTQVRFSSSSSAADEHTIRGTSVDISPGGMGFSCRQFIPRMCEGSLRVLDPTPAGIRADGTAILEVAFVQRVKVRRVQMTSHEPTYFIGVSFADPESVDPDIANRMMLLKRIAESNASTPATGGPDA